VPSTPTYKTRFAPTPSGYLHLGNAWSFVHTTALAREYGARILLRIDDMDRERVEPAYVQDIFDTLNFLGLAWDEGPRDVSDFDRSWSQRWRLPLYEQALAVLRATGMVYACRCSRTDILRVSADGGYPGTCRHAGISPDEPGVAWRLRTNHDPVTIHTTEGAAYTARLPASVQDFVVRKKDGFPAYQLTSVVDDVHFGVNLIVRGADLLPSTLAQTYLARLAGLTDFGKAVFHHHPLRLSPDGQKLSKSAGAMSIRYLRESGRSREEVMGLCV
jgi:glutamyl-tRNA synthetase